MRFAFLVVILLTFELSQVARANTVSVEIHVCERGGITRLVELQTDNKTGAPCRILYHKPTENQPVRNLWNARNDSTYCSSKYDAFLLKLENKLNWSCQVAQSLPLAAVPANSSSKTKEKDSTDSAQNPSNGDSMAKTTITVPQQIRNDDASSIIGDKKLATKPLKDTDPRPTKATQRPNTDTFALSNTGNSTPAKSTPKLASARPTDSIGQTFEESFSMELIKRFIPSGNYISYPERSHSGNTALCPADGFFIWNTRSKEKPVFEMGQNHEFQFDLTSLVALELGTKSLGIVSNQCQTPVTAGYCSNDKYIGNTPLHPALASYFSCGEGLETKQNSPALALVRSPSTLSSIDERCVIADDYHYMALAPSSSTHSQSSQKHDIELIVLSKGSKANSLELETGTVCRYVRGG